MKAKRYDKATGLSAEGFKVLERIGADPLAEVKAFQKRDRAKRKAGRATSKNRLALFESIFADLIAMGFNDPDQPVDGGDCCEYLGKLFVDIGEAFERDGVKAPE